MDTLELIVDLSQNIALLLGLAFIYSLLTSPLQRIPLHLRNALQGIVFGLFGVLGMLIAAPVAPGYIFDGRGIFIAISGYSGGAISGLITAALVAAFRLTLPNVASPSIIILVTFVNAGIGIGFHWYERRKQIRLGGQWLLVIGVLTIVNDLFWPLLLNASETRSLLSQILVPGLILFPLATWLLGTLMGNQQQQHETIEALSVERTMLRTLIDNIPDYIFIKDKNGRFMLSNIAHARAAQAQSDQALLGKTASSFFPRDLAQQYSQDDQRVLDGETILSEERRTVDADGSPIWVTTTKVPLRSGVGDVIGLVGISHDVTTRKVAEEALQESEKKYRRIIDTAAEGIWMIDADGQTTFVNPRMASLLGYRVEEMIGRSLLAFTDDEVKSVATDNTDHRRLRIAEEQDFKFIRKDGEVVWAILSTTPILDENDEYAGALAMITDITDRKRAEMQALELAAERQRVQVLKRFINDISHDFRTPLTILQTSLYILRRTASETQQQRIEVLETQVERLARLFDEMLDVYSLENDERLQLNSDEINRVISRVIERREDDAARRHQTLQFDAEENLPAIPLDAPRFEHAITHLIDNALNFTPDNGSITVRTSLEGEQIVIAVEDTGIGIAPDMLPHIFEHFYRVDQARSTKTGGSGLGLSIARKIVEAHGGRINAESKPGKGSTFRVFLPVALEATTLDIPQVHDVK